MRTVRLPLQTFLILGAVMLLPGCAGAPCNDTPPEVQVYDDPAPAASACDPCAGGSCAVPQARIAAPAVVGEYGYVLGPPDAASHLRAGLAVLPDITDCAVTLVDDVLHAGVKAARCALDRIVPRPLPSERLVRIQRVQAGARVYRPRAVGPCGSPQPVPQAPPPDGEPPPSIPAVRR